MSKFFFNSQHADLLRKLLSNPNSFLIYYEQTSRAINIMGNYWCFVFELDAKESITVSNEICDELVFHGILIPELDDIEYAAQRAVGTQNGRTYKVSASFKNVFENF